MRRSERWKLLRSSHRLYPCSCSLLSIESKKISKASNMSISCLFIFVIVAFLRLEVTDAIPFGSQLQVSTQLQAQSICASLPYPVAGWISAVPRTCSSSNRDCNFICSRVSRTATDTQRRSARNNVCINSIHIYNEAYSTRLDYAGLKIYKYNSCRTSSCGPNYCCCISY